MEDIKITYKDEKELMDEYIFAAFYYFDQEIDLVVKNLDEIKGGNESNLVSTFTPILKNGIVTRTTAFNIIKKYIETFIIHAKNYVNLAIIKCSRERYEINEDNRALSVKNRFGDKEYYNKKRLEYLKYKYSNQMSKDVSHEVYAARKQAVANWKSSQRDGNKDCVNYSYSNHIEYKYYLDLFIKQHNLVEEYDKLRNQNELIDFETIFDYAEYMVSEEIKLYGYHSLDSKEQSNKHFSRLRSIFKRKNE